MSSATAGTATASSGRSNGASIDTRDHAANPCQPTGETIVSDGAVGVALDYQGAHPDRLVVLTAGQGHTSRIVAEDSNGTTGPTGYAEDLLTKDGRKLRTSTGSAGGHTRPSADTLSQQHTGTEVRIPAVGPQAARVSSVIDDNDINGILTSFGRRPSPWSAEWCRSGGHRSAPAVGEERGPPAAPRAPRGGDMIVDGYVRVSQVRGRAGDSFISPIVQRQQIEAWAALNGNGVGVIFEELDRSGTSWDRPLLAEAIDRLERGLSDGIVVAKLDRFGRSLIESLQAIERIRCAGGTFAAVQDGLDLTTETGRLALRIMLSTAEWQLDRIREQWHTARASAISRGVHTGAQAPFGYVRDPSPDACARTRSLDRSSRTCSCDAPGARR